MVSEEIYQSLHGRNVKMMEKDSNNNDNAVATTTTITTTTNTSSTKAMSKIDKTTTIQKPIDIKNSSGMSVKIVETQLQTTNTLKRKRETKSPTKQADADSTTNDSIKKQPTEQPQQMSPTVATILVSKTKTKSGLPLLLKK